MDRYASLVSKTVCMPMPLWWCPTDINKYIVAVTYNVWMTVHDTHGRTSGTKCVGETLNSHDRMYYTVFLMGGVYQYSWDQ